MSRYGSYHSKYLIKFWFGDLCGFFFFPGYSVIEEIHNHYYEGKLIKKITFKLIISEIISKIPDFFNENSISRANIRVTGYVAEIQNMLLAFVSSPFGVLLSKAHYIYMPAFA